MKSQSNTLVNGRSLFSLNTNNTTMNSQDNYLHNFYHKIAKDDNYPYLSKILFLQLVLRQNVLIYSNNRVQIKQAWNSINKKILQKIGNIYIIDQQSKMEDILNNKSEYKRVLLYDLTQISNQGLNYLLNQQQTITLTVVQNSSKDIRMELTDIFPLIFCYNGEDQDIQVLTNRVINENTKELFQRDKFYECVTNNYNQAAQHKEEQGFLKTYLAILKDKISKNGLIIPNSRWKKMIKVLHFIGLTKTQGIFKRFSFSDCLFCSQCLGRTRNQIQTINKLNQQTILLMLPFYGNHKFTKQLSSHFWIDSKRKQYFLSLSDKLKGKVSFFYPCGKYQQIIKICYENQQIFYRVSGRDKKLMSDRYYQVDPTKKYKIRFKYRSNYHVIMHFGIACYDYNKNLIYPVQICRYQDTALIIESIDNDKIIVAEQDWPSLKNWKDHNCFNYEKCIGFYNNGNTQKILTLEQLIYNEEDSYSKEDGKGVYRQVLDNGLLLTQFGSKSFKNIKNSVKSGVSKIMNHYEGGTYAIGCTQNGIFKEWRQIEISYTGQSRQNNGKCFLKGATLMRIVIMSNYNSGYPDFKTIDKNAVVQICDIELVS